MLFLGSVNGKFDELKNLLQTDNLFNRNIIQLGNFGISFSKDDIDSSPLPTIERILNERNNFLYVLRGNIDNPEFFKEKTEEDVRHLQDVVHLRFISDYSILNIENNNILFIGGGLSTDKAERKAKGTYWQGETIQYDYPLLGSLSGIDIVVTHKPPPYQFDEILGNGFIEYWVKGDACIENQLSEERDNMRRMLKYLKKNNDIKLWISGSMNKSGKRQNKGTEFISLRELELYWY